MKILWYIESFSQLTVFQIYFDIKWFFYTVKLPILKWAKINHFMALKLPQQL